MDLAAERVVLPALRVGLDDVEVGVEEERRLRAVALHARDDVGAALLLLEESRLEPGGAQVLGDALGGGSLVAVALVTRAAIDGGDADQIAQERDARVAFAAPVDRGRHRRQHSVSRASAQKRKKPDSWKRWLVASVPSP